MSLPLLLMLAIAAPDAASILAEPNVGAHPQGARSIGMGGAHRAIADGMDGLWLNPAGLAAKRHYIVSGTYSWHQYANAHRPNFGVVDSATTVVAAGLSYNYERRFGSGDLIVNRVNFGLAYQLASIVSFGATFKYINATRFDLNSLRQPSGCSINSKEFDCYFSPTLFPYPAERVTAFTGDLGVLLTPIQYISLGVVGYNLLPLPRHREFTPIAVGFALAGHIAGLELGADAVIDFTTYSKPETRWHFGAEYAIVGMIPIRAGFILDRIGKDMFWSAGIGFRHQVFGADFGYRQGVAIPENRTLALTLEYYVN